MEASHSCDIAGNVLWMWRMSASSSHESGGIAFGTPVARLRALRGFAKRFASKSSEDKKMSSTSNPWSDMSDVC